jgi:hypothetical protein
MRNTIIMDLKSAALNVFLKLCVIGILIILLILMGILPVSLVIQFLENWAQWIIVFYVILVIEDFCLG